MHFHSHITGASFTFLSLQCLVTRIAAQRGQVRMYAESGDRRSNRPHVFVCVLRCFFFFFLYGRPGRNETDRIGRTEICLTQKPIFRSNKFRPLERAFGGGYMRTGDSRSCRKLPMDNNCIVVSLKRLIGYTRHVDKCVINIWF